MIGEDTYATLWFTTALAVIAFAGAYVFYIYMSYLRQRDAKEAKKKIYDKLPRRTRRKILLKAIKKHG